MLPVLQALVLVPGLRLLCNVAACMAWLCSCVLVPVRLAWCVYQLSSHLCVSLAHVHLCSILV